ncbi:hypothetical protein OUZ56_018959 [Daphnia magna]|uniref:Uncharacterized protein n=1 Tax=Daphnia magna TaxID=35525 RepID=A0ABQ9ZAE2_9CRUS|nr:hypothetical protein OUZ56_018959 [Daphnia magna]
MKFILAVVLDLVVAISLSRGAAIAAIGSSPATTGSSSQNMITLTSGLRSGRQQEEPLVMADALETNNEPIFRTQLGFPALLHPSNDYQLKTSGNFAIAYTGFNTFKGRADEMGFKLDSEKLNMMASQVYKAIEAYRVKNQ